MLVIAPLWQVTSYFILFPHSSSVRTVPWQITLWSFKIAIDIHFLHPLSDILLRLKPVVGSKHQCPVQVLHGESIHSHAKYQCIKLYSLFRWFLDDFPIYFRLKTVMGMPREIDPSPPMFQRLCGFRSTHDLSHFVPTSCSSVPHVGENLSVLSVWWPRDKISGGYDIDMI